MKRFTFNLYYLLAAILILIIEILIAIYIKQGFIRYTFGDVLASILVYCCIKSCFNFSAIRIAIITLIISFAIEFLQLINLLEHLQMQNNRLLSIIMGSHFSIEDLIAYTVGIIIIFIIDKNTST